MRLPRPIAAGKRRVEEMALVLEWLPEEWPDGVPSVKQLLVVALLLIPMLLLFAAELTLFVQTSALPIGQSNPVRTGSATSKKLDRHAQKTALAWQAGSRIV